MSDEPQAQEYNSFGFMTPSGDSAKSNESADDKNKADDAVGSETEKSQPEPVDDDVEMTDPDLTVAEELSEAQKRSPRKEDASKLKQFVLGGEDSRDVTSDDDDCLIMDVDQDNETQKKEVPKVKLFSNGSSTEVSSMETGCDADSYTRIKGRRTRRSQVSASPIRSSPRTKKGESNDIRRWISDKSPRRSISDPNPQNSPGSSEDCIVPASAPSQVLVEDSQQYSPNRLKTKTSALLSETVVEESQPCSSPNTKQSKTPEEGSVRLDFSGVFDSTVVASGSKNLFSESVTDLTQSQLPEEAERPELQTPTKRPPVNDGGSPTSPVVKLYKLSQEDIIRLSPSKQATNDGFTAPLSGSPRSVGRGVKRRASLLRLTKTASQEKKPEDEVKGKKINMDDIIPSSQDAFALAVQNSQKVEETQNTPKAAIVSKEMLTQDSNFAHKPENSKTSDDTSFEGTSDNETTVIEKDREVKDSDQVENATETNEATNKNSEENHRSTKSISDKMAMSDTYSESGNDSRVADTEGSGCLRNPDIVTADIDVSQECENDSQATIVSNNKVKRRKSKRTLDELKRPIEVK